ncbi:hypothetical protein V6N13_140000 [Hibiscus sabdariffa]|uniref:Uncharacterized protein n=1 Tax=Hibiscus sabdariffa TaxID=183260 RepID=A0ABR2QBT7_9ROSI
MEAEVVVLLPTAEFNFDNSCSSSYITAPSSPQHCNINLLLFTIPTSPSHDSYGDFNDVSHVFGSSATAHFERKSKQSTPKKRLTVEIKATKRTNDFEFNFSGQLEGTSLSTDELFDNRNIKPLKSHLSVFQPATKKHRQPPLQQRGRERKSGVSFSSSSLSPSSSHSSYNYNYIHTKNSEFKVESTIGVYTRGALHDESSGDKGDEVEDFFALQTRLAWLLEFQPWYA